MPTVIDHLDRKALTNVLRGFPTTQRNDYLKASAEWLKSLTPPIAGVVVAVTAASAEVWQALCERSARYVDGDMHAFDVGAVVAPPIAPPAEEAPAETTEEEEGEGDETLDIGGLTTDDVTPPATPEVTPPAPAPAPAPQAPTPDHLIPTRPPSPPKPRSKQPAAEAPAEAPAGSVDAAIRALVADEFAKRALTSGGASAEEVASMIEKAIPIVRDDVLKAIRAEIPALVKAQLMSAFK